MPGVGAMLTGCLWGPGAPSLLLVAVQVDTNLGPIRGSSGARVAAGLGQRRGWPRMCAVEPVLSEPSRSLYPPWQVCQSLPLTEVWTG